MYILGCRNSMELLRLLLDVTGSRYFKMAAAKPEVLISQLPDKIETKFQRLNRYFQSPITHGDKTNKFRCFRYGHVNSRTRFQRCQWQFTNNAKSKTVTIHYNFMKYEINAMCLVFTCKKNCDIHYLSCMLLFVKYWVNISLNLPTLHTMIGDLLYRRHFETPTSGYIGQ